MKKRIFCAASLLAVCASTFAQRSASEALNIANEQVLSMSSSALTLFSTICGIFALAGGAVAAYKMFNGEQDAAKRIGSWVGGLIVACVIMMVVKNFFF